jgi:hypothetical protein
LEIVYTATPYRGFKSHPVRHDSRRVTQEAEGDGLLNR